MPILSGLKGAACDSPRVPRAGLPSTPLIPTRTSGRAVRALLAKPLEAGRTAGGPSSEVRVVVHAPPDRAGSDDATDTLTATLTPRTSVGARAREAATQAIAGRGEPTRPVASARLQRPLGATVLVPRLRTSAASGVGALLRVEETVLDAPTSDAPPTLLCSGTIPSPRPLPRLPRGPTLVATNQPDGRSGAKIPKGAVATASPAFRHPPIPSEAAKPTTAERRLGARHAPTA